MKPEQALNVIKQTIDIALKGGLIPNLESADVLINSFNYIQNSIQELIKLKNNVQQ
jgi:hypothetical protein